MLTVYMDQVFLLNALADYLLLLTSARLTGEVLHRPRLILAALAGGLYAAATFLSPLAFLAHPACQMAAGAALCLLALGSSPHLLRVSLVFWGVSAAFAGGVLALQLLAGGPAVPDLKTILLSAAACWLFLTLVFCGAARHSGGELRKAELSLSGRHCQLVALVDTGNTLTDPATGRPVMVAEGSAASPLFPTGQCPKPEQLRDPIAALVSRSGDRRWRLIPYRSVGVEQGLLLAVRLDKAVVDGQDYGSILLALSPGPLTDGGGYTALIGA